MIKLISKGYPYKPEFGCFGYSCSVIINDDKHILFDTGGYNLRQEIKNFIGTIDAVVISHLHFDHCSNLDLFIDTKIPIFISKAELNYFDKAKNIDIDLFSYFEFIRKRINIVCVDKEIKISKNTKIIFTPGHTPGHMSLVVKNDIILAGDAIKTFNDYNDDDYYGNAYNPDLYIRTKKQIKSDFNEIYLGHDSRIINGIKDTEMIVKRF